MYEMNGIAGKFSTYSRWATFDARSDWVCIAINYDGCSVA
jgi:hypothetical protein